MKLALLFIAALPALALAADVFVSTTGSDDNPGTRQAPFATLERARDQVRAVKAGAPLPDGGITVWLAEGVYRRSATFELTAEDSGTDACPVTYRSLPGQQARIVGGTVVPPSAFAPVVEAAVLARMDEGARGHVLRADLAALGATGFEQQWPVLFRGYCGWPELFFGGRPMTIARWPNSSFARVGTVLDRGSEPRYGEKPDRPGRFAYTGDRPERWLAAEDVYLSGYWCYRWYNEVIRVARIDPAEKSITFAVPALYGVGGASGGEFYALNLLEELDAPGEYYLDRKSGTLYFWPPGDLSEAEVALSTLDAPLVALTDTRCVVFRDLVFEYTQGWVATVTGGSDNLLAGCVIRNTGGDAIRIDGGLRNGVQSCEITNTGGGGISLSGGDRATLTPCGNFADNNHIHHYARSFRTHHDAANLNGVGCRASHNLIHHAPHHAIDFGGNDQVIEFNHIHHVCMESDDAGAIYTGRDWTVQGCVIRNNFFHDIGGGPAVGNQAIYLDDNACGTTCVGNVVFRVHRAFLIGGGRNNVVDGNIIVDCPIPVHIDDRGLSWSGPTTENWVTLTTRLAAVPYQQEPWRSRYPHLVPILDDQPGHPKYNEVVSNVIVRCGEMSLAASAREMGTFASNWATRDDPGFGDPRHLDFSVGDLATIQEHAPGFQSIPFGRIGLRRDEFRRAVAPGDPWIEPVVRAFIDELDVTLGSPTAGARIHYTLDGSAPTPDSALYSGPIRLTETATVSAIAVVAEGGEVACSDVTSAAYTVHHLGPDYGVFLSDLTPLEAITHGSLRNDTNYGGETIILQGRQFARGLSTHAATPEEGGPTRITYALTGGLTKATRFRAVVGVDDSAKDQGSCVFRVEVLRDGAWEALLTTPVLRGGQAPQELDVDITGAEQLRLVVTDAGDNIYSDHAVWADARLQ